MNKTLRAIFCLSFIGLITGCVSVDKSQVETSRTSSTQDCVRAATPVNSFEVVSDREVIVHYLGNKSYSVMLRGSCPAIKDVDRVSFATGADRYIGERRGYGSVYATPVEYSRVCGRGGERLVFRTRFHDFNSPSPGCLIESIRRIP